ncbi:MAG: hypothetical protein JSS53_09665 [Proteobacteria bacterium]|nr:hypothetical protein [Pseudomonadota bacterium]
MKQIEVSEDPEKETLESAIIFTKSVVAISFFSFMSENKPIYYELIKDRVLSPQLDDSLNYFMGKYKSIYNELMNSQALSSQLQEFLQYFEASKKEDIASARNSQIPSFK